MPRSVVLLPVLALLGASILARPAAAQAGTGQMPPEIQAMATSEMAAAPDQATIIFGVETRGATAAQASQENARKQQAVIAALRAAGIPQDAIATISYTINPEMRYDEPTRTNQVVAYVARNLIRVEVSDLGRIGQLIDAAVQAGATGVSSLQYETSRRVELRREALQLAMRKACAEASVMAQAAGGTLGPLLHASTSDTPHYPPPMPMMERAMAASAADTPISPGDVEVGVMVQTRWIFVPAGTAPPPGAPSC